MFLIDIRLSKVVLENGGILKCDKAVDNYPHALQFVPDFYMTQKLCNKAVNAYYFTMKFAPECYKTQEMCNKAFNRCYFAFVYVSD